MIIETRGLTFSYDSAPVLDDVDIRIGPGVTAIIGPNAAGKSTLLKCLCGLLKPGGRVCVDGRELGRFEFGKLARLVSYMPQNLSTRAVLTVFETVLLGRLHRLDWRVSPENVDFVERLLDEMDLAGLASRYIGELSGGQVQMVAVAQALAREPTVLLMDEPTSSLDLRHQYEICTLVRELTASRGISTAIALHDLNIAARFADTVYVLHNGTVHCSGTPAATLTEKMIESVYGVMARVAPDEQGGPVVIVQGLAQPDAR